MEWDLCSGNLLVDRQEQLWLFDFGYMYPFDPLREFTAMVWPTRCSTLSNVLRLASFSWLMTRILTPNSSWRNIAR